MKLALLFFIFLIPLATAQVNVSLKVNTSEDVYWHEEIYADEVVKKEVINASNVSIIIEGEDIGTQIKQTQEYIRKREGAWLLDRVGASIWEFVRIIIDSINWLFGKEDVPEPSKQIGSALDSYFASDRDVESLLLRIKALELRIEALENTMEVIASRAYCKAKIDLMKEYNLSKIKCQNTTFYNAWTGFKPSNWQFVAITPL